MTESKEKPTVRLKRSCYQPNRTATRTKVTNSVMFWAAAVAAVVVSSASAHDISQDWTYTSPHPSQRAHVCHHLRVSYWTESAEMASARYGLALAQIKLLRARHTQPTQEKPEYLKGRLDVLEREAQFRADLLSVITAAATSEKLNCRPWP